MGTIPQWGCSSGMCAHLARPTEALLVAVTQLPAEAVSPGEERSRRDRSCAMVWAT